MSEFNLSGYFSFDFKGKKVSVHYATASWVRENDETYIDNK